MQDLAFLQRRSRTSTMARPNVIAESRFTGDEPCTPTSGKETAAIVAAYGLTGDEYLRRRSCESRQPRPAGGGSHETGAPLTCCGVR